MKKIFLFVSIALATTAFARKTNNLTFKKGQQLEVTTEVHIVPESMGATINSTFVQSINVQEASTTATTFEQKVKSMKFDMNMMGQAQSFDSQNSSDLDGKMGTAIKPALDASYIVGIDATGQITTVKPDAADKTAAADNNDMMGAMMSQMTQGLMAVPKAGSASMFKILPDKGVQKGDSWTITPPTDSAGKATLTYTVNDITNDEIIVDFTGESATTTKQEMMGMQAEITKKDKTKGTLKLDKATGILKNQSATTTSEGMVNAMGQSIPLNNTITTTTTVKTL